MGAARQGVFGRPRRTADRLREGAAANAKQKIGHIAKLLIVSEPTKTTVYMTLKSPDVIHQVKRMLKKLFQRFGEEVLRRADKTLHPMNLKDKQCIENWKLASELSEEEEGRKPSPA